MNYLSECYRSRLASSSTFIVDANYSSWSGRRNVLEVAVTMAARACDVRDIISISFAYRCDRQWLGWHCADAGTDCHDAAFCKQQQYQQLVRCKLFKFLNI